MICLGIDTSNYTTSAALYNAETGEYRSERKLLSVPAGGLGLRQSEAVFQHTVQLPEQIKKLFAGSDLRPDVVSVSVCPSEEPGSYMPCFLSGKSAALSMAAAFGVPVYTFSHQAGHIAAVLCSSGKTKLLDSAFYAFHVSGGTTDALIVEPDAERLFRIVKLGGSLDLKAGQAIDRVGKMLGLPFPAGKALDELASKSAVSYACNPYMRELSCSFSGLQNQAQTMIQKGETAENVAKYCISYVCSALMKITDAMIGNSQSLPIVFSGGVTGNSQIRSEFSAKYNAVFAENGLASDNAVGIAWLGAAMHLRRSAP